jgi:hypothetical protein
MRAMQPTDSSSSESVYSTVLQNFIPAEPILIQGNGHVTLFGLNNHFSPTIPNRLRTRVAPEEYELTMLLVNKVLRRNFINNLIWFFCGCISLCCTLGCSMCPVIYFNKRTIRSLHKTLKSENNRLYNKLGLNLSLHKHHFGTFNLVEYVIVINFLQKPEIYVPD